MKLTQETSRANTVRAWAPGEIRIREEVIRSNVVLTAERIIHPWRAARAADLQLEHMQPVLELQPDVIVLGTGEGLVFPQTSLYGDILARGIGLEVMDTSAACRTFNILVHEDRRVAAALIILRNA